jgi:xanthine dehydrogenase YagR molybdenum-binding subunit
VGVLVMGQGARNVVAAAVAEVLRVPVSAVTTRVGDTADVPHHLTAGAWGTTTAVPAARKAALKLRRQLRQLDPDGPRGRTPAQILRAADKPFLSVEARNRAPGTPRSTFGDLRQGRFAAVGPEFEEFVSFSYIAHFVEVRVEPTTRRVRVARVVSVADCGSVLSRRTAISQVRGGVIWGIGGALREISEVDERFGGFVNNDIAEYVIPCHADIGDIEAEFIDRPDTVLTDTGAKNLGELVMVGVAPAITNAIHHATGKRFRSLPVRVDDLFS